LAEGVLGVIEVKSNLSRKKLIEALVTLKKVKDLRPNYTESIVSAGFNLDRPLRFLFSYDGATWETILSELIKPENNEVADLVCILNRGVLISRGLLMTWAGDNQFYIINSRASPLAFLYRYLVAYGASFFRSLDRIKPILSAIRGMGVTWNWEMKTQEKRSKRGLQRSHQAGSHGC
jgi:hypothetical protein